jgi:hypothetical protein
VIPVLHQFGPKRSGRQSCHRRSWHAQKVFRRIFGDTILIYSYQSMGLPQRFSSEKISIVSLNFKVPGTILTVPGPSSPGDSIAMAHLGWLYIEGNALPFDKAHGRELLACAAGRGADVGDKAAMEPQAAERKTSS